MNQTFANQIIANGLSGAIVILSLMGGVALLITAIMYGRARKRVSDTGLIEAETRKIEAQIRLLEAQRAQYAAGGAPVRPEQ